MLAARIYELAQGVTLVDGLPEAKRILAVNHDGDTDSTGSIAGNLLGAALGVGAVSTLA